jgi:ribosome-binding factor A
MGTDRHRSRSARTGVDRLARVNVLIGRILAEQLERRADADERLRLVTVTGVLTDRDLRRARILLDSLDEDRADALDEHRVALQAAIGREAHLRFTPTLSFAADPAVAAGERIDARLRQMHREES